MRLNFSQSSMFTIGIVLVISFMVSFSHAFNQEEFVPTKEWQEVPDGVAVPGGLHIRMDLDKGGKWAKLIEEEEPLKSFSTDVMAVEAIDQNLENNEVAEIQADFTSTDLVTTPEPGTNDEMSLYKPITTGDKAVDTMVRVLLQLPKEELEKLPKPKV